MTNKRIADIIEDIGGYYIIDAGIIDLRTRPYESRRSAVQALKRSAMWGQSVYTHYIQPSGKIVKL